MLVNGEVVEKSLETKAKYLKRAKDLIERAYKEAREKGVEYSKLTEKTVIYHDILNQTFVGMTLVNTSAWFKKFWGKELRPATVRQYRSALKYFTEREVLSKKVNEEYKKRIFDTLDSIQAGDKKILPHKTSSAKQKHLKEDKLSLIVEELKNSKSKWNKFTIVWLYSAILTGLRPCEWRKTTYDAKNDCLNVANAKVTNQRSHGEFRTIYLSHLDEKSKKNILTHISITKHYVNNGEIEIYYRGCSALLRKVSSDLFPKAKRHITLYSARHQYSANLKASGLKSNEIAALMGHATDETAMETYGKKQYGSKGLQPDKISLEEVSKVKVKYKQFVFNVNPTNTPNKGKTRNTKK
jgi:integrase